MNVNDFSRRQAELMSEFARYVVDHPEVDAALPEHSYVYFEVAGEHEFNHYSRELAENHHEQEGAPIVLVRIKGLAPPHTSRLIEPVIEQPSAMT